MEIQGSGAEWQFGCPDGVGDGDEKEQRRHRWFGLDGFGLLWTCTEEARAQFTDISALLLLEPVLEPPLLSDRTRRTALTSTQASHEPSFSRAKLLTSHDTQHGALALRLLPSLSPSSQKFHYHRPVSLIWTPIQVAPQPNCANRSVALPSLYW
ncbi:hypothetical protein M0R45_030631 [Rubus argutus]|uniref:Uncharacterized protein n=1 Tax=Rubus argutus TaxID=59490 RepID=A0AAW1WE86_RUBAR